MSDALISPVVGATMLAASGAAMAVAARRVMAERDDRKVPLMGVLGAFVFAAQMVNFAIPGTGSSGHIGGGMILAALLGPWASFLVMASVLTVQALFFADGGLLALGCNVMNLGALPAFVAYPLAFKPLVGSRPRAWRLVLGSLAACVIGLQLGALGVVIQTVLSGISELPFATFALVMQPIHLAIGLVEGAVTAAVVSFVWRARPEVLGGTAVHEAVGRVSARTVLAGFGAAALLLGAFFSWFASAKPDGLEWSVARAGGVRPGTPNGVHRMLERVQGRLSFLPGYGFKPSGDSKDGGSAREATRSAAQGTDDVAGTAPDAGTTLSGILGGALTLLLAGAVGFGLRRKAGRPGP